MDAITAFQKVHPAYKEFMAEQVGELDEFVLFEEGFHEGRKYYPGQVIQVSSDTWFQFNGKTWHEMNVEEQIEWSRLN
jgi:hypothetical protein